MRRTPRGKGRRLLLGATAVLVAAGLLPPVQARAKALAVLAEALGYPFPRPFASDVTRRRAELGGVAGDLYVPAGSAPAVLLVPGAAPEGPNDERVIRLATALARAGRIVFVPEMELAQKEFTDRDVDGLVRAALALGNDERSRGLPLFLGFSYGGSFALLAAADPRLDDRLLMVATFGAYFDLVGVAQAVTTGSSLVGSDAVDWEAHPRAGEIFEEVIVTLTPEDERAEVEKALRGSASVDDLSPSARTIYEFATNSNPTRTYALAERLPGEMKKMLARFSPASVADRIEAPVIALHSTDDPVVPFGEAVRLERAMPRARVVSVSLFRHVDLEGAWHRALPDLWRSWRFTSWILSAQE